MLDDPPSQNNTILIFRNKQGLRDETLLPLLEPDPGRYPPLRFYRCAPSIADGSKKLSYFDMVSKDALAVIDHGGHIDVRITTRRNVLAALALARQYLREHQGQLAFKGTEQFRKLAETLARERGIHIHTEIIEERITNSLTWITGPASGSSAAIVLLDTARNIDPTIGFSVQKNGIGAIDLLVGRPGNSGVRATGIFRAETSPDRVFYRYIDPTSFQKSTLPSFVDSGSRITLIQDNVSTKTPSFDIPSISAMVLLAKMKPSWRNQIVLPDAFTADHPFIIRTMREAIRLRIEITNAPLQSEFRRLHDEFRTIRGKMSGSSPANFYIRVAEFWARGKEPESELRYFKNLLEDRSPIYMDLTPRDGLPTMPVSVHQNVASEGLRKNENRHYTEKRIPNILRALNILKRSDTKLITDWVQSRLANRTSTQGQQDFDALESFLKVAPPDLTRITEATLRTALVPWITDLATREDLRPQTKVFRQRILSSFFEYGKQKSLFSTSLVESAKPPLLFLDWYLQTVSTSNPISVAQAYADLEGLLDIVRMDVSYLLPVTFQRRFSQWSDNFLSLPDMKPEAATHRLVVVRSFFRYAQTKGGAFHEILDAVESTIATLEMLPPFLIGRRDFPLLRSCHELNAKQAGFTSGLAHFLDFAPDNLQAATRHDFHQSIDTMTAELAARVKSGTIPSQTARNAVEAAQRLAQYAHEVALPSYVAQRPDVDFLGSWYHENRTINQSVVALKSFLQQAPPNLLTATTTELSTGIKAWIDTLTVGIGAEKLHPSTCLNYVGVMTTLLTKAQKYGLSADVAETGKRTLKKGRHDLQLLQSIQDLPAFTEKRSDQTFIAAFYRAHPTMGRIAPALEMFFRHFPDDLTNTTCEKLPEFISAWISDLASFVTSDDSLRTGASKLDISERYINVVKSFFEYGCQQGVYSQGHLYTAKLALDSGKAELRRLPLTRKFPPLITERSDSDMVLSWLNSYQGKNDHLCAMSDFLCMQPPALRDIGEIRLAEEIDAWSRRLSFRIESNEIKVKTASHYVSSVTAFFKYHLTTQASSIHPFHQAIVKLSETQSRIGILKAREPLPSFIADRPDKEITVEWYRNHPSQEYSTSLKGFLKFASNDLREMNATQFSECLAQWLDDIDNRLRLQELSLRKGSIYILGVRSFLESCEEHLQPGVADLVRSTLSPAQKTASQLTRRIPIEPSNEERRGIRIA